MDDAAPAGAAPVPPPPVAPPAAAARPTLEPPAVSPLAAAEPPAVRPGTPAASAAEPLERRPTDPAPRPVRTTTAIPTGPVLVAKAGDVICANCHTPNDPSRHFCRGCGRPLVAAAPVRGDPWWRRFFRKKAPLAAGTRTAQQTQVRRGTGGIGRTLRNVLALVLVAAGTFGLAGYVAVPSVRSLINNGVKDVMRNFEQPAHVYPTGAAGDAIAGHPASLAVDRTHNHYWAGPTSGSLPRLDFTFSTPTDIVAVIVTPGAEDDVLAYSRPKELRFTFSDGTVLDAQLADASLVDPAPGQGTGKVLAYQTFNTNAREVTAVTVEVRSLYQGARPAVAIAEIEFFTKP